MVLALRKNLRRNRLSKRPSLYVFAWFLAYFLLVPLALWSINLGLPHALEVAVSVFIAPAAFAAQPFLPLLKTLGLTTGEWIRLPSLMGWIILSLIYAGGIACLYGMWRRFSQAQRKPRQ